MQKLSKLLISQRIIILAVIGGLMFLAISHFHISLWYVLLFGIATGVIFGKVFCRWMCPMGFIMEFIMGRNPDSKFAAMYQYHKMGCPIAWISGLLNKWSIFKIKLNLETCKNCGLCDKQCYISTLDPTKFSLYKADKIDPGSSYSCSKCLKCVEVCPNGSLSYNTKNKSKKNITNY
jgi:polyferredoxin